MNVWHPDAVRVPHPDSGPFLSVPAKLVFHTTEGYGLPAYKGDSPHFTLSLKTGKLWQHVPVDRASSALVHPPEVETNHAHAIQVELTDAFAKDSQNWTPAQYAHIASLARWIERNAGVARKCSVAFGGQGSLPPRLSPQAWIAYSGHLGHQHVPGNLHWDPGAFRIGLVLGDPSMERKRHIWAVHLARVRHDAKRWGWTKPRRILARQLKRLLGRK